METTANEPANNEKRNLINTAIYANAGFTILSALTLILFADPLGSFIGLADDSQVLRIIGMVLAVYVPFLLWTARMSPVPRMLAWTIIDLDLLWVAGSAVLIFTDFAGLTSGGKWTLAIIADIVAAFAAVQYIGLRKQSER